MISSLLLQSNGHYCFVLFLTICSITSGHFLSTTTSIATIASTTTTTTTAIDHHNHSSYRHKQLQLQQLQQLQLQQLQQLQLQQLHQQQHHLPIIVPAISRSRQHAITRRAIQSQHQHLSFTNDYHSTTPTLKLVKKINMLQIDEELKALKRKRKRLRQLREEVRELSEHLKNKRTS
ncbi:unnamed protein product, partial [Brugia timori]|uniref:BZIP domain-containing protein n=1 Tax=Brugia timori TaxID=42155 RepID=A0A0R3QL98_9BILA